MDEIGSSDIIISENTYKETEKGMYVGDIPKGKKLNMSLEDISRKPAFMMVGTGNKDKNNKGTNSMDYTKELLDMTKPEGFMFGLLMENRISPENKPEYIKTNQTYIDNKTLTATEIKYVGKAYRLLRNKDLIVRTHREHYIINPRLVISNDDWKKDEKLYIEAVNKLKDKD